MKAVKHEHYSVICGMSFSFHKLQDNILINPLSVNKDTGMWTSSLAQYFVFFKSRNILCLVFNVHFYLVIKKIQD